MKKIIQNLVFVFMFFKIMWLILSSILFDLIYCVFKFRILEFLLFLIHILNKSCKVLFEFCLKLEGSFPVKQL